VAIEAGIRRYGSFVSGFQHRRAYTPIDIAEGISEPFDRGSERIFQLRLRIANLSQQLRIGKICQERVSRRVRAECHTIRLHLAHMG
jgi:hypothetical protein